MNATGELPEDENRKAAAKALYGSMPDIFTQEDLIRNRAEDAAQLSTNLDVNEWIAELADLRSRSSTGKGGLTVDQILAEDRAEVNEASG